LNPPGNEKTLLAQVRMVQKLEKTAAAGGSFKDMRVVCFR